MTVVVAGSGGSRLSALLALLGRFAIGQTVILTAPFVFYLVPFLAGYGWSAISPLTPTFPGMPLPPGRQSALPTTVEYYGTGVVVVGFQARLRAYLRDGELPLWNPYSGLGHPFAAQGEGGPYFPLSMARSLLPTSLANLVTFGMIGISAVSMFCFLRLLGLSPGTAAFGGAAWSLSGGLTLNLARNNMLDQVAMIPSLFAAAAWAIVARRVTAYVVLALVVGLHALAGMLQIGVNALLLLAAFVVFFSYLRVPSSNGRHRTIVTIAIFVGLGTALAGPYVLPIIEAVQTTYNKNVPLLAYFPMPSANILAFFFPLMFGQIFQSWIIGRYPDVVDWNNLYAHGGTGLLLLTVLALATLPRTRRDQRLPYLFFLGGLLFFLGRFMSFPPVSLVNFLPILSQQSPKHSNGVAVFCLVVAACYGVEWLRSTNWHRTVWLLGALVLALTSSILTLIGRRGGLAQVDGRMAAVFLGVTLTIALMLLVAFWLAHRAPGKAQAALIATAAVVGESSIYLLLGNDDLEILAARVGVGALVVLLGVLAARRALLPAAVTGLVAIGAYAWIVIWPESGLPKRVEIDAVPPYMAWLRQATGTEYRAFGINPDFSSIGEIQDVEVVGPLATNEWVTFVNLVSSPIVAQHHRIGSTFSLVNKVDPNFWYDLHDDYPKARPLLDWVGVRYIVLDKAVFNGVVRSDHELLQEPPSELRLVYDDESVTILESPTAQTKAFFTTHVREVSLETIVERLQKTPSVIDEGATVEVCNFEDVVRIDAPRVTVPVPLAEYRPNDLRATFDAPGAGIFVVKDSFFPGWQATLNGQPAEVIRVSGMVRGVVVLAAGRYEVTMSYRPISFVYGVAIAASALVFLVVVLTWDLAPRRRTNRSTPRPSAIAQAVGAG